MPMSGFDRAEVKLRETSWIVRIRDALPRGVSPRRSVHGGAARAAGVFVRVEDEGAVGGIERIAGVALVAEDSHNVQG